jgi:outer membrane protein assembly factor BamB
LANNFDLRWLKNSEQAAAIDKDGTIYIASTDGKLYAIGEKMKLYP